MPRPAFPRAADGPAWSKFWSRRSVSASSGRGGALLGVRPLIGSSVTRTAACADVALPNGHKADLVADALAAKITTLPFTGDSSQFWEMGPALANRGFH